MTGNCLVPFYKRRRLNHTKQLLYNRYRQFEFTPLHHPVPQFSDLSENRSKSARLRVICDHAWTQRAPLRSLFAGIKPKLSAPDFAWSICKTVGMRQNLWPARCNVGFTKAIPT
jgi:hypothetical protein